tara:strand:+ start:1126 stop:1311 length:186 start_codon:yes stop_codon:yes gene_type:complete
MFEPNKTRACVSSFEYQEVEAYKFINSIEFSGHPLNANQRSEVLGYFLHTIALNSLTLNDC